MMISIVKKSLRLTWRPSRLSSLRRNFSDSADFPVNPEWTKQQTLLRKQRSARRSYNGHHLDKNGFGDADFDSFDGDWGNFTAEAKQYWSENLRPLQKPDWIARSEPTAETGPTWLDKLLGPHTQPQNEIRVKQLHDYFQHFDDAYFQNIKPNRASFYQQEITEYGNALRRYKKLNLDDSQLQRFSERTLLLNQITDHAQITAARAALLKESSTHPLPDNIRGKNGPIEAIQNWYESLPLPKYSHIGREDFELLAATINQTLAQDITELVPETRQWIRLFYSEMVTSRIPLTEIETHNWIRLKLACSEGNNVLDFLSLYPYKLHVSHFNLLLPIVDPQTLLTQMNRANISPDRTTVVHLLEHYGSKGDLNSVLNTIFFTIHDLRLNLDSQLIESFIGALIKAGETKLALFILVQTCHVYEINPTLEPHDTLSETQTIILDYLVSNFVHLDRVTLQHSIKPTAAMIRPFLKVYDSASQKDVLAALVQLVDKYDIEL
ncbi:hypothetical protein KL918_002953 [Ogataea parapolymorpha]|uniref:Uncharacterized protein n=1 Tax=Ogataea parapolymorpha (strain ATCC 26012 / BCRC 20466 / JCM 22074 / NRRL Y-7560 / DL-1) TaxID=871575 RepID=W1QB09_OGAPD|nr:hypothetical protein HPODL_01674 [Ogataea parapolymorpha DL-1]ESW97579.1 hypothetical protein HPODL_01674 [Ogataea parapolymorpha DL-1]KAG7866758.1 hypothetical protein KL918_002953 [Ogataea parapolymorpha]KAG7871909.1 hypothetical protein KL916_003512 [Ogataea parapolymorpha]